MFLFSHLVAHRCEPFAAFLQLYISPVLTCLKRDLPLRVFLVTFKANGINTQGYWLLYLKQQLSLNKMLILVYYGIPKQGKVYSIAKRTLSKAQIRIAILDKVW